LLPPQHTPRRPSRKAKTGNPGYFRQDPPTLPTDPRLEESQGLPVIIVTLRAAALRAPFVRPTSANMFIARIVLTALLIQYAVKSFAAGLRPRLSSTKAAAEIQW
jgi:hypothetical protein